MGNINILEFLDAQKSEGLCLSEDLLFKFRPRARLQAFLFYFSFVPTRASRPLTFVCISPSRFEFRSQARLRAISFYFNFAPKRAYGPFPFILISIFDCEFRFLVLLFIILKTTHKKPSSQNGHFDVIFDVTCGSPILWTFWHHWMYLHT